MSVRRLRKRQASESNPSFYGCGCMSGQGNYNSSGNGVGEAESGEHWSEVPESALESCYGMACGAGNGNGGWIDTHSDMIEVGPRPVDNTMFTWTRYSIYQVYG